MNNLRLRKNTQKNGGDGVEEQESPDSIVISSRGELLY